MKYLSGKETSRGRREYVGENLLKQKCKNDIMKAVIL